MKKHLKNVGLLAIGVVVGVTISFAPDIQAATSKLLGGKVAKVVTVKKDGEVIGEGGIINGTTYLPVRTLVNSVDGIEVGSVTSSEVNLVTDEPGGDVVSEPIDPVTNPDNPETPVPDGKAIADQEQAELNRLTQEKNEKINGIRTEIRTVNKKIDEAKFKISIEDTAAYKSAKMIVENYEKGQGGSVSEGDYKIYKAEYDRMNKEKQEAEAALPGLNTQLTGLEAQLAELLK
ncbi:hypothetical protein [Paenibacillus lactis]|uniref:hypothetical protein n=1 Tax=Paenibacillus lactis TaxID=228574 RepID=UPI003691A02C